MIELRVVLDPLVFPNPEPAFRPLSSFGAPGRDTVPARLSPGECVVNGQLREAGP